VALHPAALGLIRENALFLGKASAEGDCKRLTRIN
jgi:hypothetical protein